MQQRPRGRRQQTVAPHTSAAAQTPTNPKVPRRRWNPPPSFGSRSLWAWYWRTPLLLLGMARRRLPTCGQPAQVAVPLEYLEDSESD